MAVSMSFWLYLRTSIIDSSALAGWGKGGMRLSRIGGGWRMVTKLMKTASENGTRLIVVEQQFMGVQNSPALQHQTV